MTTINISYSMRISEVMHDQFSQASFVSIDTDVATESRTKTNYL